MAPTEILAEQHFDNFRRWFEALGLSIHLLTSSSNRGTENGRWKTENGKSKASDNSGTLFIGTHALIESAFAPERLGLVIIDEQHKFGVSQREKLLKKGNYPHLLVMTATPIPRTLGLTLYGDLDISTIEQPPAGRGKIQTFLRTAESRERLDEHVGTPNQRSIFCSVGTFMECSEKIQKSNVLIHAKQRKI
jgi:ATP-dependent DNA helicase RecG